MNVEKHHLTYWDLSGLIAMRNIAFPVEYLLEKMKSQLQKDSKKINGIAVKRLFCGQDFSFCFALRVFKDCYQFPLTFFFNQFWKAHISEKYNQENLSTNALTGFSTAICVQTGMNVSLDAMLMRKTPVRESYKCALLQSSLVWTAFTLSNYASSVCFKQKDPNVGWFCKGVFSAGILVATKPALEHFICRNYRITGLKNLYRGSCVSLISSCISMLYLQSFFDKMNGK